MIFTKEAHQKIELALKASQEIGMILTLAHKNGALCRESTPWLEEKIELSIVALEKNISVALGLVISTQPVEEVAFNGPAQATIIRSLEASRDFMTLLFLAHKAHHLFPTASAKVIEEFELAINVALEYDRAALLILSPQSVPSTFIFDKTDTALGKTRMIQ